MSLSAIQEGTRVCFLMGAQAQPAILPRMQKTLCHMVPPSTTFKTEALVTSVCGNQRIGTDAKVMVDSAERATAAGWPDLKAHAIFQAIQTGENKRQQKEVYLKHILLGSFGINFIFFATVFAIWRLYKGLLVTGYEHHKPE
jgi:hypothetical protein